MDGHDMVIHLASNPDIARAAVEPDIDFREGTFLTQQVVEAMRAHRHADVCSMLPAAAFMAIWGNSKPAKISARWFPSPPMAPASWRVRR